MANEILCIAVHYLSRDLHYLICFVHCEIVCLTFYNLDKTSIIFLDKSAKYFFLFAIYFDKCFCCLPIFKYDHRHSSKWTTLIVKLSFFWVTCKIIVYEIFCSAVDPFPDTYIFCWTIMKLSYLSMCLKPIMRLSFFLLRPAPVSVFADHATTFCFVHSFQNFLLE